MNVGDQAFQSSVTCNCPRGDGSSKFVQYLSTHVLSMSFHVIRPRNRFLHEAFPTLVIFSVAPAEIRDSNVSLYPLMILSFGLTFTLSASPSFHDQEMNLVRQDQLVSSISSTWELNSASFPPFLCYPRFPIRITLVSDERTHIQFGTFSHSSSSRTSLSCLSHKRPASR